ncbi:MAG TPA: coenzyme F420-0:L-glutamate ligase, partial [Actinomycetaceae bacterium]|nr:coenzyme F420-0:L-glutamate ligase [Actinomycetaceae bacterium]
MLLIQAPEGLARVTGGDDLAAIIAPAVYELEWPDGTTGIRPGDIFVVASKIVAKAERRLAAARDDAELDEAIASQTVRVVAERTTAAGVLQVVETPQGLVMAAGGVGRSNAPRGTAVLLPEDPDASARHLRRGLAARLGLRPGVIISDTVSRPWREGVVDIAIGAAGVAVLDDQRGRQDLHGRELVSTVIARADEIAAAAELVKGKARGRPVAVVRGLAEAVTHDDGPGAAALLRPVEGDL